jgi:uracil phosphoribosyltransferase
MTGYLHQPEESTDGCSYITPLQDMHPVDDENNTVVWIAVLEEYPRCVEEMLSNVEKAGYGLILATSENDTGNVDKNSSFPIVIITDQYYNCLVETSLSNLDMPTVLATVKISTQPSVVGLIAVVTVFGTVCVIFTCSVFACWLGARRRRRQFEWEIQREEERQRNYRRFQSRDHLARQELVESILRQLQQLQLNTGEQQPLGAVDTKKLPKETYKKMTGSGPAEESCAICVEDFHEGDLLRVLPCTHHFHLECIDEWLINHSDLCPLCKNQVPRQRSTDGLLFPGRRRRGRGRRRRSGGVENLVLFTDEEETEGSSEASELPDAQDPRLLRSTSAAVASRYGAL